MFGWKKDKQNEMFGWLKTNKMVFKTHPPAKRKHTRGNQLRGRCQNHFISSTISSSGFLLLANVHHSFRKPLSTRCKSEVTATERWRRNRTTLTFLFPSCRVLICWSRFYFLWVPSQTSLLGSSHLKIVISTAERLSENSALISTAEQCS